jgi:GNAT superfamily N-acetyltransferase
MKIVAVNSPLHIKEFHQLPFRIYAAVKQWVPHIEQEVEAVFNSQSNKFFRHGEAIRWILQDDSGQTIGRVAAFINKKKAFSEKQPTGGLGFFECINDEAAAFLLFDTAKQWLQEREMEAMDGPINFGERDRYWGLLVDGFDNKPIYGNPYQPAYYQDFFESYGFQTYFEQFMYERSVHDEIPDKYKDRSAIILQDPGYTFRHLEKKKMFDYAEDFRTIYNKAWKTHSNFKGMPAAQARSIMKKLKPVMDEKLIWFAYYNDEPVAFFIALPELNQIFKHINGNLNWLGKLQFLYHKWKGGCTNVFGVAFGIAPAHQKKGLEGALIMAIKKQFESEKNAYEKIIMTWIGDFNPKMIRIVENLGVEKYMTLRTYRKLFDENATFERCKTIE